MKKLKIFLALICFFALPANADESPYFTGNGGKGKSIAILSPEAVGFEEDQNILLIAAQGELVSNFSTYSAISVLDRANLHEQYKELSSGIYNDNKAEAIGDLGNLPPTEYIMSGRITKIGDNCNLQLRITKTADKMTAASYSGTATIEELNNLTAIRQASLFLLEKIGVTPTARTKTELSGATESNRVNAQFSLARGITAQRQGTEVAALSYFYQAAALDHSLLEATDRSSVMAVDISSGNIGADTRNKIAWRQDWIARLTEAEQSFDKLFNANPLPYTLFYAEKIIPGNINYQTGTQELSINTNLHASGVWIWLSSVEKALQAVYDGLEATKMKSEWGLESWPWRGVTNLKPFERKWKSFSIAAELVNSRGMVIGKASFESRGDWGFNGYGRPQINISDDDRKQVRFASVKADDITDNLTIRIASVNGIDASTAARNGVLQIKAISEWEWNNYVSFKMGRGGIVGYNGEGGELVIPDNIWNEPVAFIGENVFRYKNITEITIGGNVEVHENAFGNRFSEYYNRNVKYGRLRERMAGTYTYYGEGWELVPKDVAEREREERDREQYEMEQKQRQEQYERDREQQLKEWAWERQEAYRTSWHWMPSLGGGWLPFMTKSIDSLYTDSKKNGLFFLGVEGFYGGAEFIHIGLNMDFAQIKIDKDKLRKIYPNANISGADLFKIDAFVILYPVSFWYLLGSAGFYHASSNIKTESGKNSVGTSAPILSVGTGFGHGLFLEAQYNILPSINSNARYFSIRIGFGHFRSMLK